jgi:hypothetical protein
MNTGEHGRRLSGEQLGGLFVIIERPGAEQESGAFRQLVEALARGFSSA